MVTVSSFVVRQSEKGDPFIALVLEGDLELVKSRNSDRFYATTKKCSISTTFNEKMASLQVGKQLPGRIIKQECDPYEYLVPESGEVVKLSHTWMYVPDEVPEPTKSNNVHFSKNGHLVEA